MTTTEKMIVEFLKKAFRILNDEIFNMLAYLGEECIRKIRDRTEDESWYDHSSNLRSTIGYAIYDHGYTVIQSAFETLKGGVEGTTEGKRMVADLASQYANTYALVVVAAMNYADKVEALENKDVLESTRIWAQGVIEKRIERALEVAEKKINALTL